MSVRISAYAPVDVAVVAREPCGSLGGYAAPERGPRHCRLELVGGTTVVAVADASGFSAAARNDGVRHGWCRFDIGGLAQASALGEPRLRCAVSGNVVHVFDEEETSREAAERKPIPFSAFRDFIGDLRGCSGIDQVLPFLEHFRQARGDRSFIEALYVYLHNRKASSGEVDDFQNDLPANWSVKEAWRKVISSQEFIRRGMTILPGVFAPGFAFGLDILE